MVSYILTFLSVALFPLALAAYGGHLATLALGEKPRKKALAIVWSLAVAGVVTAGLQQVGAYRSDKQHDAAQGDLRAKLDQSLQRQQDGSLREEYMRGQLDSITIMIGKLGQKDSGRWPPAVVTALAALARNASENAASKQVPAPNQSPTTLPNPYMNMPPAELRAKADILINQFANMSTNFSQSIANVDKRAPVPADAPEDARVRDEKARFQTKQELYRSMVVQCRTYRADAILLTQAMQAKTGVPLPGPEPSCLSAGIVNFPSDLQAVSDYLRKIRNEL